ncbi:MAG: ribosomal protein S18-alanine N-acetyltransferase [Actinomycetota bacterium]
MATTPAMVRPMRWWDIAAVAELDDEIFGLDAWAVPTWWGEFAQPNRTYLIADRPELSAGGTGAQNIQGYSGVAVAGTQADLMTLAVAPQYQGLGVGRLLLDSVMAAARDGGAMQLFLEVRADNVAAQRLYDSAHFERISVRRGYYRGPGGPVDAVIMRARVPR